MKRLVRGLLLIAVTMQCALGADSVVVFNEIQYHPVTNETLNEWVELHNQMAIDIDLSGWRITGTIGFDFAEGTIIPGGGYLVVASNPTALQAATGVTNVVGPFLGRLNNSDGRLNLRDRNDRLMDEVDYRDGGKWPAGPDGSGATLAKRQPNSISGPPENWISSVFVGGTPGRPNFPGPAVELRRSLIPFNALWRFEASGTDQGTAWRAPTFDDTAWPGRNNATLVSYWPFDGNATATRGVNGTFAPGVAAAADRNGAAGGALAFNGVSQFVQVEGGGGLNAATAGTISLWVKWTGLQDADCCGTFGAVFARQGNGVFSDDIIALSASTPASARVVWRQSGGPAPILITGTTVVGTSWHHVAVTFGNNGSTLFVDGVAQGSAAGASLNNNSSVPLTIGAWGGDGAGFAAASLDDVAIWDQPLTDAQIAQLAAQTKTPLNFVAPESAVYYAGDGRLTTNDELRRTLLPLGPRTYYFRSSFLFGDDPALTTLKLDLAVDDGAVFYLNGAEVYRHNLPPGAITYSTFATSPVGDAPLLNGISLPTASMVTGTNLLAVEVHQAAPADGGMVFGAGLNATIAPASTGPSPADFLPGDLVFNEITAAGVVPFQIELINRGALPLETGGYSVERTGASPDAIYPLPAQTLGPGQFLILDQASLGFGAVPGDKLFLFKPARRGLADTIEVHERPRGRSPDGTGEWLTPAQVTAGASNTFQIHQEVVFNEIMYHGPPTLEVPAILGTNLFLTLTNVWRYDQSGTDLGSLWRAPQYDDSGWAAGAGLLYVSTNSLPAAKNTLLTLGPTTYYFRTTFVYTGAPTVLSLSLRHVVDDGAIFYLNGTEISRFNLAPGPITYTNEASASILNAALRSPVPISLTNLILGNNVLAVEVHQAANSGNDVAFGAELNAVVEAVPRVPFSESPEQWVELFNRSDNAIDLTGWRLDEGIDYRFASNTMIPPGGYLVIAKDPAALLALFPGIPVVGPYTNNLSHHGARLVLKDAADNPANAVHYFDGGHWPEAPDAGGPSLELRDPRADNSVGEAWAASNESSRSAWRTYSYRGVAAASPVGPDGQWHEFVIGLLEAGEVLLDDIRVIETPSTTPTNLIQNSTFDSGTNKWRLIGNHHGEVIDDPDQPGNKVLRLVATGSTDHMSNHGETTFVGNRDVANGREYLITFRAKWIQGGRQFLTRLYFNRLARITRLDIPVRHGTPGTQNSSFTANLGPTCTALQHLPAVPAPFVPVTVSVEAGDPDAVLAMNLWSRVEGGSWISTPMTPDSSPSDDPAKQRFSAILPGKPAGTVVQFYIQGMDGLGVTSTFPLQGPNSRVLYKVDDGLAATNGLHNFRLVTLTEDADQLFRTVNLMSNERIGCTVIYDEQEIFYDIGLRLKGSEHSRTTTPRLGFNVSFAPDQRFRGIHDTVALDRSESVGFGQREMLIHQTANHCGGVPTKYHDLVQIMAPRPDYTGSAELQLARYSDVFLEDQYDHGGDGMVFEYELIYQLNGTDNGTPEGNKVPAPDSVTGTVIRNLGPDKEGYRWTFLIKNNEDRDDFSRIMLFAQTMELTGNSFNAAITNVIEVDQWLRGTALNVLSGMGDSYGGDGSQHNVQFYARPGDGRVLYFPHDLDAFFSPSRSIVPNTDLSKIISVPTHARTYYNHLLDILTTTYNGTYMTRWANHFKRLLPAQNFASHLAELVQRANNVTAQVNAAVPNVAFAITSNGGNSFGTSSNTLTITGTAPLAVRTIEVNGVSYPLTWITTTTWSLALPLLSGPNLLAFQGVNPGGVRLTNATDTITVTNSSSGAPFPVLINEWMADNTGPAGLADPSDGLYQDWIELFNPNTNAVNLAGFYLTDNLAQPFKWQIPLGTVIGARNFLLVWADGQPAQNALGPNSALHASFQLNNVGEAIGLFSPGGVAQHALVFREQMENVSQGLFPDGNTNAIYAMTNWTPLAANTLAGPLHLTETTFQAGLITLHWSAVPGRTYQVEFANTLKPPTWSALGNPVLADDFIASVTDPAEANQRRFYRVRRLD